MAERSGPDDLAIPDPVDDYLSLATLLSTVVPVFGGAVGHVFSEWSAARRTQRLREVLVGVIEQIQALGVQVREEYVRSDEFEDLLDQTLRRVSAERHEEKRRLYRGLLLSAMTSAETEYDEQLRFLRIIEQLQVAHVRVLRALIQPFAPPTSAGHARYSSLTTSQLDALRQRLPDVAADRIADLMGQLDSLGVVTAASLRAMAMTVDLRTTVTAFGQRFVTYVLAD
jgi:hypothetical protein